MMQLSVIPVISIELSKADIRQLYVKILESFWAPFNVTAPITKLQHQAEHMIRSCKTRMLIIDEIQALRKGSLARCGMSWTKLKAWPMCCRYRLSG